MTADQGLEIKAHRTGKCQHVPLLDTETWDTGEIVGPRSQQLAGLRNLNPDSGCPTHWSFFVINSSVSGKSIPQPQRPTYVTPVILPVCLSQWPGGRTGPGSQRGDLISPLLSPPDFLPTFFTGQNCWEASRRDGQEVWFVGQNRARKGRTELTCR